MVPTLWSKSHDVTKPMASDRCTSVADGGYTSILLSPLPVGFFSTEAYALLPPEDEHG